MSGELTKTFLSVLKVPKNLVASITILKWKFGTSRTHPRAGHLAKLSNQGRGDQEPRWSLCLSFRDPMWRWEKLPEGQPSLATPHPSRLYGRVTRRKTQESPLFGCMLTVSVRKILWSEETKIEQFGLILSAICLEEARHRSITFPIPSQQ